MVNDLREPRVENKREKDAWRRKSNRVVKKITEFNNEIGEDLDQDKLVDIDSDNNLRSVSNLKTYIEETLLQVLVEDLGNGKVRLSLPQNVDLSADVEFDSATLDDLTPSRLVSASSLKRLISTDFTDWLTGSDLRPVDDDGDGTASFNDDELEFYIQAVV